MLWAHAVTKIKAAKRQLMNKRNSIILGLLFIILIVQIIVLAPKDAGLPPDPDELETKSAKPKGTETGGQMGEQLHLMGSKPEGKEWELWTDKAARLNEDDGWNIERVKVKFFADNGVLYTVTGKRGRVIPEKNFIRIEGDVVTRSSNGYILKTETIYYDSKARLLTSPTAVAMTGPKEEQGSELSRLQLTGADMLANLASNEIKINDKKKGRVHAKKEVKDHKIATITSDRAIFSGRSNMAHFSGDVVMDLDTMRITGPEAKFAYNATTGSLTSVDVEGGARVTDTDKFATSKSVSVQFVDDRVVFTGSPRVVQNGDELVGDEIIFEEGGKRVRVSNAKAQIDSNSLEKKN
jgi:LPS export ABC transporter protein LptC/lipopolysaccharide transport protein LptA